MIYTLQYLDGLFQKDPKSGGPYHERQVQLYALYDAEKLLPFLRSCNDIPLQKVCVSIIVIKIIITNKNVFQKNEFGCTVDK